MTHLVYCNISVPSADRNLSKSKLKGKLPLAQGVQADVQDGFVKVLYAKVHDVSSGAVT